MMLLFTAPPPAEVYLLPNSGAATTHAAPRTVMIGQDNDDATLPPAWRAWWHVCLSELTPGLPQQIEVHGITHPQPYLPVYSYDNVTWHHVSEQDVVRVSESTMVITMAFSQERVWVAQHVPYTVERLQTLLAELREHPHVRQHELGQSQQGRIISLLTVTDPAIDDAFKRRVLVHARTHPGEVGSSWVVEGLLHFLVGNTEEAEQARRRFIFDVVPMLNPDGVAVGNYRTTPAGENLEVSWERAPEETEALPAEVQHLQQWIFATESGGSRYNAAINVHATHSDREDLPYLVRHFGPNPSEYGPDELRLWAAQQTLSEEVAAAGPLMFDARPQIGGGNFLSKGYPETFWWHRSGTDVLASTFETVYGQVGLNGRWMTPDDHRTLGAMLAKGLVRQQSRVPTEAAVNEGDAPSIP